MYKQTNKKEEGANTLEEQLINFEEELRKKDELIKQLEEQLKELNKNIDQRVVEKTVEVNRLLRHNTKFIDSLSHDLGTPLTPLVTLLPLLKQQIENPKHIELIETCIRNAEYIKRVVNNTRKLAELRSTDLLLKKENLSELFEEITKKYEVVFKSCKVNIQNNIEKEVYAKTDKTRFIELLDQLFSNAVNSMIKDGGIIIFSSKPVKTENGTFIQVSIKDTGEGLTRNDSDRIFDEFYKVDPARHKLDSTGLGLSICKHIIEKHGGKIWADSHGKGTGTSIHFTLPSPEVVFTRSF